MLNDLTFVSTIARSVPSPADGYEISNCQVLPEAAN